MKMKENYTMLFDFYEMTMANGYFNSKYKDSICYFDVFFRSVPDKGGYAIFCGLESIIDYILNLKFTEEDINYLVNHWKDVDINDTEGTFLGINDTYKY